MPQVEREVLAPNYARVRGGGLHLAANAKDQGWPHPGSYLRSAFPDRLDTIEQVIAEHDRVGLLFRLSGTQSGNYCGIEPTGNRVDIHELAMLRIAGDQMVEGWFMMDECELLVQLRCKLPQRRDATLVAPALPETGDDPDVLLAELEQSDEDTPEARNKRAVVQAFCSGPRAHSPHIDRRAFPHLHDDARSDDPVEQTLRSALSEHRIRIEALIAEGSTVWARINFVGRQVKSLYGIPAEGRNVGGHVVVIAGFEGERWSRMWCLGDELGLLIQLGRPDLPVERALR
jgi:predicted ester cyclase